MHQDHSRHIRRAWSLAAGIATVGIAFTLSACSAGGATYNSPTELKDAYVKAGGACPSEIELTEAMLGSGAHGIGCGQPMAMLIVFDSEEKKNRYLASISGADEWHMVGGSRWTASGEDAATLDKLGGSTIKDGKK